MVESAATVEELHALLMERVVYGGTSWESQTAVGALLQGQAVCDGYADALTLLFRMAGIPCGYIVGMASDGSGYQPHAWNIAWLEGHYTLIDPTWNDMDLQLGSGLYYGLSTAEMADDHRPDAGQKIPACQALSGTARSQTLTATTLQDLYDAVTRLCQTGETQTVLVENQQLYNEVLADLQGFLGGYAKARPQEYRFLALQVSYMPGTQYIIFMPYTEE